MRNNNNENIKKITSSSPSKWMIDASFRKRNKWLRYSSQIARRIIASIEDSPDTTQTILADKLGVSKQRVSKIIKGNENLTLETIYKIEQALSIKLIQFPEYKYSYKQDLKFISNSKSVINLSIVVFSFGFKIQNTEQYYTLSQSDKSRRLNILDLTQKLSVNG
jgi:transcriptional regulator with XRE-family HTH domain